MFLPRHMYSYNLQVYCHRDQSISHATATPDWARSERNDHMIGRMQHAPVIVRICAGAIDCEGVPLARRVVPGVQALAACSNAHSISMLQTLHRSAKEMPSSVRVSKGRMQDMQRKE